MLPDKLSENLPDALSNDYDIWDKLSNYCDILDKLSNDYNIGIGQNVNENTFLIYVEFIRLKT